MKKFLICLMTLSGLLGFTACNNNQEGQKRETKEIKSKYSLQEKLENESKENLDNIYLAGGCFWGLEEYFKRIDGIVETEVGYANGKSDETDYNKLKETDHAETVKLTYDKSIISLDEILLRYFKVIDPTSINKQGNDIGRQYRTGVYYTNKSDIETIERIFDYEEQLHGKLEVEKEALRNFIKAEDYHQDYLEKTPSGYCHINLATADEALFDDNFKLPDDKTLKNILDEQSYRVLKNGDTERAFTSDLNDEYRKGIYVDKATGEPLFSSSDKFNSGCGWPSFSKPITTNKIEYKDDDSHGMNRIEVRSKGGHLGHVFNDGPKDKGGLRYCINGASLKFIPYEKMDEEGYSDYKVFCK